LGFVFTLLICSSVARAKFFSIFLRSFWRPDTHEVVRLQSGPRHPPMPGPLAGVSPCRQPKESPGIEGATPGLNDEAGGRLKSEAGTRNHGFS
jgi:hypothetical protein